MNECRLLLLLWCISVFVGIIGCVGFGVLAVVGKGRAMKSFVDGDQIVVVRDDFVNLQESPAVFVDAGSPLGQLLKKDGIGAVPEYRLQFVLKLLRGGGGELEAQLCCQTREE